MSSDFTNAGLVYTYRLEFFDSAGTIVTQPSSPQFSITVVDPCLATILVFPSTLTDTTITCLSGVPTLQEFAPAKDTASTAAGIPGLCGPHVYSIVEAIPQNFVSIVAPTTNLFTSYWTLSMLTNNFADVGVWTVTLQGKLENYASVAAVFTAFQLTVLNPCVGARIHPLTLTAPGSFKIALKKSPVSILSFMMNTDSVGVTLSLPLVCGIKTY